MSTPQYGARPSAKAMACRRYRGSELNHHVSITALHGCGMVPFLNKTYAKQHCKGKDGEFHPAQATTEPEAGKFRPRRESKRAGPLCLAPYGLAIR